MKKQDHTLSAQLSGGSISYNKLIFSYIISCIVGLAVIVTVFNGLISDHDKRLTNEICTLISEKMDTSIRYMSTTVREISTIVSCYEAEDLEAEYQELKRSVDTSDYLSIGIVDAEGNVYSSDEEKQEFEKWGLVRSALDSADVTISEPYRSSMTGQLVFTMFSPVIREGKRTGTIFVTYPLDDIQKMANTDSLKDETEIWIMDGYSDNMIRCSGSDSFLIGSWSNFKMDKSRISNIREYEQWQQLLRNGEQSGTVSYVLDDVSYAQVFKRIDFMPGWNVVVRIPSRSLSNTMQIFRGAVIAFAGVLIIATLILLAFIHKRETEEKKIFENLSVLDPLTRIMNRRAFETSVQNFFEKNKSPECMFMFFDVDYFKQVNDKYGHDAGDYILVEFSSALNKIYSDSGLVARYGGDEFVVFIRGKSREAAEAMTEHFAELIGAIRIESDPDFRLHFSAGMAACPFDAPDLSELMKCADDALYEVKKAGRNGWRWYKK